MTCTYCQREMDEHSETIWNFVQGWEKRRETGGTNHIALRTPIARYCCHPCMTLLLQGLTPGQESLGI